LNWNIINSGMTGVGFEPLWWPSTLIPATLCDQVNRWVQIGKQNFSFSSLLCRVHTAAPPPGENQHLHHFQQETPHSVQLDLPIMGTIFLSSFINPIFIRPKMTSKIMEKNMEKFAPALYNVCVCVCVCVWLRLFATTTTSNTTHTHTHTHLYTDSSDAAMRKEYYEVDKRLRKKGLLPSMFSCSMRVC
jgi:hypothetical protein